MMELTVIITSILVLLGSCHNAALLSLDMGHAEIEQITINTGESTTIACQAGLNSTDTVYWLSLRYRRFISKDDILFDYGGELNNFELSVDYVNHIYYLHIFLAGEEVNGMYLCYSSTTGSNKQVLWAGEVTVLSGSDFSSAIERSDSGSPGEPIPLHAPECSASYIPPMMNMINMGEVEMELRCSWSAFDHPDASPTLFCNGEELLSKYFIGEMVMARVMLRDIMECYNFTCALKEAIGEQPFQETCSYMQEIQSGLAPLRREGVRIDPMYSVIEQGMDAMFVCIASADAPRGTFKWNVSSRLFDTKDLVSSMEITQSTKSSTMLMRDVQVLTDEPMVVRCQLITDDKRKNVMSEALLTIMPKTTDNSTDTSTKFFDKTFGIQTILILAGSMLVLFVIIFCCTIYVCKSKKQGNTATTPTRGSNNNDRADRPNRKISMYVSMKEIWNRNISRRARHPIPVQTSASNRDIPLQSSNALQARHPAHIRELSSSQESLNKVKRMGKPSLQSNPVICIDDNNYIVPDASQESGSTPVVLRPKNPRRAEGHYSSTDVMVGSRELMSSRSSREGMMDRDGYLVPSMEVNHDLGRYVYATSDGTSGNSGEHRKSASCHELSNYSYATYQ